MTAVFNLKSASKIQPK